MIIIETCPKCGHDLQDLVLATYPPIPKKECFSCGWSWTGEPEEVVRVPFGGNTNVATTTTTLNGEIGVTNTTETLKSLNAYNLKDSLVGNFEQSVCVNCSNNPKNGGSGICHCTLGQPKITY